MEDSQNNPSDAVRLLIPTIPQKQTVKSCITSHGGGKVHCPADLVFSIEGTIKNDWIFHRL